MAKPLLIVGNRNYSSWSLRAHMALDMAGIPYEEEMIRMFVPSYAPAMAKHKAAGKVPVLVHNSHAIWDTLAIIEYAAETWPAKSIWPKNKKARALARSFSAEMHSGFQALRNACPMNLRRPRKLPPGGISEAVAKDMARIESIWTQCRKTYGKGGSFLFGKFTAADAMFAPVCARIDTFAIPVSRASRTYANAILATPAFQQWKKESADEPWIIEEDEVD
jgi:glutathione S-transferase